MSLFNIVRNDQPADKPASPAPAPAPGDEPKAEGDNQPEPPTTV